MCGTGMSPAEILLLVSSQPFQFAGIVLIPSTSFLLHLWRARVHVLSPHPSDLESYRERGQELSLWATSKLSGNPGAPSGRGSVSNN